MNQYYDTDRSLRGKARFLDELVGELEPEGADKSEWYRLHERLRFWDGKTVWTVPKGFACDLASIPALFRWIADWRAWRAGVLHDFLCREARVNRLLADALFVTALNSEGMAFWRQVAMYLAVRCNAAWRYLTGWRPAK